jgi:hypothetical protein
MTRELINQDSQGKYGVHIEGDPKFSMYKKNGDKGTRDLYLSIRSTMTQQ